MNAQKRRSIEPDHSQLHRFSLTKTLQSCHWKQTTHRYFLVWVSYDNLIYACDILEQITMKDAIQWHHNCHWSQDCIFHTWVLGTRIRCFFRQFFTINGLFTSCRMLIKTLQLSPSNIIDLRRGPIDLWGNVIDLAFTFTIGTFSKSLLVLKWHNCLCYQPRYPESSNRILSISKWAV